MPPPDSHRTVSPAERALLRRWIAEGAVYEPHWAFTAPVKAPAPEVSPALQARVRNPIDAFIFAKAEASGLPVAPEAPPEVWLRRVFFGLTGLPPLPEETAAFTANSAPDALENVIARLT